MPISTSWGCHPLLVSDIEPDLRRRLSNWRKWYLFLVLALTVLALINLGAGNAETAVLYLAPVAVSAVLVLFLTAAPRRRR